MGHSEAIMVGGHPLSGELQGAKYEVTRLHGWWDRPNVKRHSLPRELADGDFPQPWDFEARYIEIDGFVTAQNHEQLHHILDQLNGLAVFQREYLTVQGHGQPTSALVEAEGGALVTTINDRMGRFELRFKANDPRRYGREYTEEVSTNWRRLVHYGNYPAIPSFNLWTTDVGSGGFQIYGEYPDESRRTWWYNLATSGAQHRVYFATGAHLVGGNPRPERIRRAETFIIPPREYVRNLVRPQITGDGTITGTVSWRDTWI